MMSIARTVQLCFILTRFFGDILATPPSFYSPSSATTVTKNEDAAVGTQVYILVGIDSDGDALTYGKVSQTPSSPSFTLNSNSGVLSLPAGIDAETTKSFAFQFSVSDGTSTVNSPILTVEIADVNDNSPSFSSPSYTATIYDTAAVNSVVKTLTATDPDSGDILSFSITAGNTPSTFAIGSSSGQITVATPGNLNPSTKPTYTLTVRVSDGTHTATSSVTITVLDDPCSPNPCLNSGTCTSSGLNYNCSCTSGWMGTNCQTVDHCASSPCEHSGTCYNNVSTYNCVCTSGWIGENCNTADHCSSSPCENSPSCYNNISDYYCSCDFGWIGKNCNTDDPCIPNPCANSGNCTINGITHNCACASGYSGVNCTEKVSEPVPKNADNKASIIGGVLGGIGLTLVTTVITISFVKYWLLKKTRTGDSTKAISDTENVTKKSNETSDTVKKDYFKSNTNSFTSMCTSQRNEVSPR